MYQKTVISGDIEAIALEIPGVKIRTLHTDEASGATTVMTHIEAGASIPQHWHTHADETVFVVIFGLKLGVLPISGSDTPAHFVLPAIALGYYSAPAFMRLIRAEMIDVLDSDYIRTARAKGLSEARVVLRHALSNAVIPVVSLAAVQFGFMLGGSVVIETIFAIEGLGALAWESISRGDFPVVQATVFVISIFYVLLALVADVMNAAIDPRLRRA